MTAPVGTRIEDLSRSTVESGVRALLENAFEQFAGTAAVVVPEVHYPHHQSTGLVANPAVVEAVCAVLVSHVDELVLLPAVGADTDPETTLELFDYEDRVAPLDVEIALPDQCRRTCVSARVAAGETETGLTVSIPRPLVDRQVLTIPTLRTETVTAPGLRTLGLQLTDLEGPDAQPAWRYAVAANAIAEPVLSLLDGTYVFAGSPHRGRFLVAGKDPIAVDEVGATILGCDSDDTPALRAHGWTGSYRYVEGLSPDALASELPDESTAQSEPSERLQRGYQLYARVTGDAVPPQLLGTDGS